MPVPMEYRLASQNFEQFLADVAEETGLGTRNQAFTTTQGVLVCFRRRLDLTDAIAFAQVLPAMLRALFVADWDPLQPTIDTWDRDTMISEVKQLRAGHNFSSETAIRDVALVVRRHADTALLERNLATLSPEARAFWS